MTLRHITPGSIDWADAMDEGGGGRDWEKLAPEELTKLRQEALASGIGWSAAGENEVDDYGWGAELASR